VGELGQAHDLDVHFPFLEPAKITPSIALRRVQPYIRRMAVQHTIETKIRDTLAPVHLEVVNESHRHSVPPNSETHFKLVVVSEAFTGAPLVQRHREVNGILSDELATGVHALALQTLTPEEWARKGGVTAASPDCRGGSKADRG
jgi:BolA protein